MAVAREEDGDGRASAEVDCGVEGRQNGEGHGLEVILDVDDQQGGEFRVRIPLPGLKFLVRRHLRNVEIGECGLWWWLTVKLYRKKFWNLVIRII